MHLKLLQWNIWYKEKIENIASLIKEIDPDIFCLQELGINNKEIPSNVDTPVFLAETTKFFSYFHEAHRFDKGVPLVAIGNGIFSRFPIVETNYTYLTKAQTHTSDYSHEGRIYNEATIKIYEKELTVGTTHLSYTDRFQITPEKKEETDNLVKILKEKHNNFIFTGDLNATPTSYTVSEIEKLLIHAGPDFSEKTWTTKPFSYNGFHETDLTWRLDYIFATPDLHITSSKVAPTDYSDHLPILVTIEL